MFFLGFVWTLENLMERKEFCKSNFFLVFALEKVTEKKMEEN